MKEIIPLINTIEVENYHEPFVGSATVFLNISVSDKVFLSDSNESLINFYFQVQNNLEPLIEIIQGKENSEAFFYSERQKLYNCAIAKAAQFYFLNRTCFNGIYRVNSEGKFNVPYGRRYELVVADISNLNKLKEKLKGIKINSGDFTKSSKNIKAGDLVYFDPPYSSLTNTKSFLMYNETLFSWNDQVRLKDFCEKLISKDVKIILNNLYNEEVYKLFCTELGLKAKVTTRFSGVGSQQSSRGQIKEYLFTNLDLMK
ncbi:MAG: DNA adenine methylase [Bacteroidota bacterium]|nr:DNA adenine methylase [Bacteroidota bacterium]